MPTHPEQPVERREISAQTANVLFLKHKLRDRTSRLESAVNGLITMQNQVSQLLADVQGPGDDRYVSEHVQRSINMELKILRRKVPSPCVKPS